MKLFHYKGGVTRIPAEFVVKLVDKHNQTYFLEIIKVISHPALKKQDLLGKVISVTFRELYLDGCYTPLKDPNFLIKDIL